MEDINQSIARGMEAGRPTPAPVKAPTARDCMTTSLVTFKDDQTVRDVVRLFLSRRISGGPVVDQAGNLVGMISEMDCLRAIAAGAYDNEPFELSRLVAEIMTRKCITVDPGADIYTMTQLFAQHSIRRLPVLEEGALVGQVSRRDILDFIQQTY
jgi:CBS domain-containing protein